MDDVTPILVQLESTRAALLAAAERIPENRWQKAPEPGAWSAGEIFAHLVMVESRVNGTASRLVKSAPVPVPLWKRVHLPVSLSEWRGIKVKTPIPLDPSLITEKQAACAKLDAVRQFTLQLIEQNRERDLAPYRFPHPFFGSLNMYDWFRMLGHHEARHTKQLREIAEKLR